MNRDWKYQTASARDTRIRGASVDPVEDAATLFPWLVRLMTQAAAPGISAKALVLVKSGDVEPDVSVVSCGTQETPSFERTNGLRCAFSFVLREMEGGARVETSWFQVHRPVSASEEPKFLRYEYDRRHEQDPTVEPDPHWHPGNQKLRIPAPVLSPRELIGWFLGLQAW